MTDIPYRTALIVGAGPGISASLARGLAAAGLRVGVAARNVDKLAPLAAETGAETFAVDASHSAGVARLFDDADTRLGEPDVVVYNASARAHGPIAELDPEAVRRAVEISAYGGFLVVQRAARPMIRHGRGAILLTAASASVKGYPSLQPLRRGNLPGVVWRRARRANSGQKAFTLPISSSTAGCAAQDGRIRLTGLIARSIPTA
jgi:NAD(P)-dependent dehydrogenase (short-subunit alcohol dehydrogenase family)